MRRQVATVLVASAGASGAVAGVALAIAWSVLRLPGLGAGWTVAGVGVALLADTLGRPRPVAVRSQVPRQWTHLFDIRTAAALYGSRLGVGPLTILETWLWWVTALAGASQGIAGSALVGGVFGVTRIAVVVVTSRHLERAMVDRMASLRARERVAAPLIGGGAMAACLLALHLT